MPLSRKSFNAELRKKEVADRVRDLHYVLRNIDRRFLEEYLSFSDEQIKKMVEE